MDDISNGGFSLDALVDDLSPVRSMRLRDGLALTSAIAIAAVMTVVLALGVRQDMATGLPDMMFFVRGFSLLALGVVTALAGLSMATPSVRSQGRSIKPWHIALGLAALFPLSALAMFVAYQPDAAILVPSEGIRCLLFSGLFASIMATGMTLWLRQGAPTNPDRAGWLVGLAAGSFGAMAYGFHCPFNNIIYIGTWYSLAVILGAVAGRLVVPRFLRW